MEQSNTPQSDTKTTQKIDRSNKRMAQSVADKASIKEGATTWRQQARQTLTEPMRQVRTYLRQRGSASFVRDPQVLMDFFKAAHMLIVGMNPASQRHYFPCPKAYLPHIILQALCKAQTNDHVKVTLTLMESLSQQLSKTDDKERRGNLEQTLLAADPALFLPFCRPAAPTLKHLKSLFLAVAKHLQKQIPEREGVAQSLTQSILRRMCGDHTARSPLLVGPPGVGKSYMLQLLAQALTQAGLPTRAHFVSLAGNDHKESTEMQLLGTDYHYSNGNNGQIYEAARDPQCQLVLLLLDEADKCTQRNLLIQVLDPTNPLHDKFVRGYLPEHDMRWKVIFLLSANDTQPFRQSADDPLWSRIAPLEITDYTGEQKRAILMRKAMETLTPSLRPNRRQARQAADKVLELYGSDLCLRSALDLVNRELFSCMVGGPAVEAENKNMDGPYPKAKKIGFRMG